MIKLSHYEEVIKERKSVRADNEPTVFEVTLRPPLKTVPVASWDGAIFAKLGAAVCAIALR